MRSQLFTIIFTSFAVNVISGTIRVDESRPSNTTEYGDLLVEFCNHIEECYEHVQPFNGTYTCKKYYATYDPARPCLYERKSRLAAVILEFFFGWMGAGRLYLGRIEFAVAQLLLYIFVAPSLYFRNEFAGGCMVFGVYTVLISWMLFTLYALSPYCSDMNGVGVYSL